MTIPRDIQIDIYRWTTDNARSRDEYREHPTAACPSLHDPEPCDELATTGDRYCRRHRVIADKKLAQRKRKDG